MKEAREKWGTWYGDWHTGYYKKAALRNSEKQVKRFVMMVLNTGAKKNIRFEFSNSQNTQKGFLELFQSCHFKTFHFISPAFLLNLVWSNIFSYRNRIIEEMYILILFGSWVLITYIKLELQEEININDC